MLRLAFAGTFAARLEPEVRARLEVPCEVLVADESTLAAHLPDIDVLVTMAFTAEMGGAARRLKLVQVPGAGLDRIDRAALPPGAWLANAYGHEAGIAEFVIGAMLALTRQLGRLDAALRQGVWDSQWAVGVAPPPPWPELAGRTLGILGYGRIGQALARRARAFDMDVCAIRRDVSRSAAAELAFLGGPDALDEVLRRADYLAITLSLSDATRGLIGERELRLMKRAPCSSTWRAPRSSTRRLSIASWRTGPSGAPLSTSGTATRRPRSRRGRRARRSTRCRTCS